VTLPSAALPEETKPAPPPLRRVQAFVNTWEGDTGIDLLAEPASARAWLADAGLLAGGDTPGLDDLAFARDVRESIRALLVRNGGGPAPAPEDLRPLETLARAVPLHVTVGPNGLVDLVPDAAGGLAGPLCTLLVVIRDAQGDGSWTRLKACRNDDCRWAFYDRSHGGRGAWCDMAVCGNRIKNRNLRARRR